MHFAGDYRSVRCAGGFIEGQGVHLGTQANCAKRRGSARNVANHGVTWPGVVVGNAEALELRNDALRRLHLLEGKFRVLMQPAPEGHHACEKCVIHAASRCGVVVQSAHGRNVPLDVLTIGVAHPVQQVVITVICLRFFVRPERRTVRA